MNRQSLNPAILTITFDLWDTIIHDDSDEPKQAARGLPPKKIQRRRLLFDALNTMAPIERSAVDLAYDTADAAFNYVWREQHVTWTIAQRLRIVLQGLSRSLPDPIFDRVVADHQSMEIDIEPDL